MRKADMGAWVLPMRPRWWLWLYSPSPAYGGTISYQTAEGLTLGGLAAGDRQPGTRAP